MFPPKKILFPVDFSERCTAAARMVETFTGHFQAELTLLHVVQPPTYNDLPFDATALAGQQLNAYLVEELEQFDVQRVLLHGEPAHKIADYAHSHDFDLIMLPTHGHGRFRRLILGSVTAKVLHDVSCPVWTGVHMEQVPALENIAFHRIACAIDLGQQSCPALRIANSFASEFGADLSVVHAVPEADPACQDALTGVAKEKIQAVQACTGSNAKACVLKGEIARAVCDYATRDKADLLVIGRSVAQGMLGRLKANAYSIIRQSPCPVISV